MQTYTASRISSDANFLYPDTISIDNEKVIYFKGQPFGYETIIIPRHTICGVYLNSGIFFANIVIASAGKATIEAKGFKKSEAKKIVNTLT